MSVSFDHEPLEDIFAVLEHPPTSEYPFFQSPYVSQPDSWYSFSDVNFDLWPSPGTSPTGSTRNHRWEDESCGQYSLIEPYPAPSYRNAVGTCPSPPQKRPPYYCQRCNRTFSTTTNFTRHDTSSMCATNARGDPISHACTQCNKTYNRKDNLKKHIKDKHPVTEAGQSSSAPR